MPGIFVGKKTQAWKTKATENALFRSTGGEDPRQVRRCVLVCFYGRPLAASTGMLEPLKNAKCSVGASDCHSKMNSSMVIHYHLVYLYIYTVWWTNIAMETNFEDVSLKMRDFHFHVSAMYILLFNEQTWTIVVCCPFAVLCTQSEWLQLSSFFLQNFSFPSNLQIAWTIRTPKNSSWSTPPFNTILFPFRQGFWESMFVCSCRMFD